MTTMMMKEEKEEKDKKEKAYWQQNNVWIHFCISTSYLKPGMLQALKLLN